MRRNTSDAWTPKASHSYLTGKLYLLFPAQIKIASAQPYFSYKSVSKYCLYLSGAAKPDLIVVPQRLLRFSHRKSERVSGPPHRKSERVFHPKTESQNAFSFCSPLPQSFFMRAP